MVVALLKIMSLLHALTLRAEKDAAIDKGREIFKKTNANMV